MNNIGWWWDEITLEVAAILINYIWQGSIMEDTIENLNTLAII